jgi:hypothetical protein
MNETLDRLRAFQSRLVLALHGIAETELRRLPRGDDVVVGCQLSVVWEVALGRQVTDN